MAGPESSSELRNASAGPSFELDADQREILDSADRFARKELYPLSERMDAEEYWPEDAFPRIGAAGFFGVTIPERYGGLGADLLAGGLVLQAFARWNHALALSCVAHDNLCLNNIYRNGSEAQRRKYLPDMCKGLSIGALGLTEPGAGSDVRSIRTKATKVSDGWMLRGQKAFISNAGTDMSFGVTVLARLGEDGDGDGDGDGGRPRFGSFIVERGTEGYSEGKKLRGIGWHGLDTRELFFDDVFVSDDQVVGEPGAGLGQFLGALEVGRISIAALSVGTAQGALNLALDYAKQREQFGERISGFQAIQFKLADMATEIEAARWLTYRAAALRDAGEPFKKEAAMAKLKASRTATAVTSEAVQIFGGTGYMLESPIARFYCDAKVLEIGEGTNEIQHLVIARELGC